MHVSHMPAVGGNANFPIDGDHKQYICLGLWLGRLNTLSGYGSNALVCAIVIAEDAARMIH